MAKTGWKQINFKQEEIEEYGLELPISEVLEEGYQSRIMDFIT